jgi:hypothetical protein
VGTARLHSPRDPELPSIVAHELMHALGYGHTTARLSAMQTRAPGLGSVTVEDAACAQLLMRLHALQQDPLILGGLVAAR